MENLHQQKHKTDLFSAVIQNTQIKVEALEDNKLINVSEEFLIL